MADQKFMGEGLLQKYDLPTDRSPLDKIFEAQKSFGSKFCNFDELVKVRSFEDGLWYIKCEWYKKFIDCIQDEISEVRGWLPWKHWKDYSKFKIEASELKFELIDILHFVVSELILSGQNSTDVARILLDIPIIDNSPSELSKLLSSVGSGNKSIVAPYTSGDPSTEVIEATLECLRSLQTTCGEAYKFPYRKSLYVNMFYILMQLFYIWGMSDEDIYSHYMSKNKENFDRQARGY